MASDNSFEPEHLFIKERSRADEVLQLQNWSAPRPFGDERFIQYERRLTDEVRKVAPNYKDVNVYEASGKAYELIKDQIYADARKEAHHPTNIPDGELKQVTRYDAAGRPYYEFYGKTSAWMKEFMPDRKKLAGIKTHTDLGYAPENVRGIAGLKY